MVVFVNPACAFPTTTTNIPQPREVGICLNLGAAYKNRVLRYGQLTPQVTKNQQWSYFSNKKKSTINGRTFASQNDLGSIPNIQNYPQVGNTLIPSAC